MSIAGAGGRHGFILLVSTVAFVPELEPSSGTLPATLTSKKVCEINSHFSKDVENNLFTVGIVTQVSGGPVARAAALQSGALSYKETSNTDTLSFNPQVTRGSAYACDGLLALYPS